MPKPLDKIMNDYSFDPEADARVAREIETKYRANDKRLRRYRTLKQDSYNQYKITGCADELKKMEEVEEVLKRLKKLVGYDMLNRYSIRVTAVYTRPNPRGFDFRCCSPGHLLDEIRTFAKDEVHLSINDYRRLRKAVFNEDGICSAVGHFAGWLTHGKGFREIGTGESLHVEIASDGKCNAHIDVAGIVSGSCQYDIFKFPEHGVRDVLSGWTPFLYGNTDKGYIGPFIGLQISQDEIAVTGGIKVTF